MPKWLEQYQTYITIALVMFIAIGGLVLMYEQQRDKITAANNNLKVEKASWQQEKTELTEQINSLQSQVTEIQKQKTAAATQTNTGQVLGATTQKTAETNGLININSADLAALDSLPSIGATKAQAIIDYRTQNGGFKKIDDLKNVKGIGDATFQKLKSKITI